MKRKLENAAASRKDTVVPAQTDDGKPTALITICNVIGVLLLVITLIVCFNVKAIFGYYVDTGWAVLCVAVAGGVQAVLWFAIGKILDYLHIIAGHTAKR